MSTIESVDLKNMEIGQLRQYAKHLRLPLEKTATKPEIVKAIEQKLNGKTMPQLADATSKVPPGYAKIKLLEDPMPGASNSPAFVNINGYMATIPRGVEVIVPMRVVRTLNDAVVNKRRQSMVTLPNGREEFRETSVKVPSYPFQILEMTPGEEPKTALEEQKEKMMGPRKQYRNMFLRWPTRAELARAIEQGLIKLNQEEVIESGVVDLIEQQED